MTLAASLLVLFAPQVFPGGDLKLPPGRLPQANAAAVAPSGSDLDRFRRELIDLRGAHEKVEGRLRQMARDYQPAVLQGLMIDVARSGRAEELDSLMVAARRFATATSAGASSAVGDELLFQLLSRPLGDATRNVLATMVELKGTEAKFALKECLRSRVSAVRRHAADALLPMLTEDDLAFVQQLSREQTLDLQLRAVDLLGAIPAGKGVPRLVELLARDPALAGAAASTLVRLGEVAQPALLQQLEAPPIDRSAAYAGFALALLAGKFGPEALPASAAAPLAKRLRDPEPVVRALVAVPLADLLFRGVVVPAEQAERLVVDALIDVVAPRQAMPNLDLLLRPAEERMALLTGRTIAATEARSWWAAQRDTFVGVRASVTIDAGNVAQTALTWRHDERVVRVLGAANADLPPVAKATEIVLSDAAMLALLGELKEAGFLDPKRQRIDGTLPRVRSLQLEVGGQRSLLTAPVNDAPAFDAMTAVIQRTVAGELWQLYRGADVARGDFWRGELAWREANPDPAARGQRLLQQAVQLWPALDDEMRGRAVAFASEHPQRAQLFDDALAEAALLTLRQRPELKEFDLRLLELAAAVPGDRIWREALTLAVTHPAGGRNSVRAVFAVLGPDAVLQSLNDGNPDVRLAGVEEAIALRDKRSFPRLVELLQDKHLEVQRMAVYAVGQLRIEAASRPLVEVITGEATTDQLRREAMQSLGRTGGDVAFPVLQRMLAASDVADRECALRALGDLADPRAANLLAELAVVGDGKDLGHQATAALLRQPSRFAVPALRSQLGTVKDQGIRNQLVLALGSYQDPEIIPDLLDMLRDPKLAMTATSLLACTTGIEFRESEAGSRIDQAEAWWRTNRELPQWQWLLDALSLASVQTTLRKQDFAGPVQPATVLELARLLQDAPEPRLWPLCAAVLRRVTNEDHGSVNLNSTAATRAGVAERYRLLALTQQASAR